MRDGAMDGAGARGDLGRRQFLRAAGTALCGAGTVLCGAGGGALALLGAGTVLGQEKGQEEKKGGGEGRGDRAERKKKKAAEEVSGPYAPFRMGLQSYSLRKFGFEKMVETLHGLELRFVELWGQHFPLDLGEFEFRSRMRIMRHNSVRPIAYGVVPFTADHEKNKALFELAKELNLHAISADPAPDSFSSLDKLVEEYRIAVAIHNHGPEDKRYRTPEMIEKAIAGHHQLIGLCVDTGHFLRADVDPVAVVKKFRGRIYGVHLKEVKSEGGKKRFTVLGQGDLDTPALLRALQEGGFRGGLCLEYEEEEDNPTPSIEKCLAAVREAVKKLG